MNRKWRTLQSSFIHHFCLLVILPFCLILTFLLVEANHASYRNEESNNRLVSSQVLNNLSQHFGFAEKVSAAILENSWLMDFLDRPYQNRVDLNYYSSTVYDYVKISNGIASNFRLRIYLENDTIPLGYGMFYHMKDLSQNGELQKFYASKQEKVWIDGAAIQMPGLCSHKLDSADSYCYLRKIMQGERRLGLILVLMPKQSLGSLHPTSDALTAEQYQMMSAGETVLYNFTPQEVDAETLGRLRASPDGFSSDRHHFYGIYNATRYPFGLIVATPRSANLYLMPLLIVLFLFLAMATVFMFVRYSRRLIGDINYCLDAMNESIDNNFRTALHVERRDEISIIAERINYLLSRIHRLIDLNIEQQVASKGAQLLALQHQINPHFLYNTMEIFSARMELAGLYDESAAMAAFCRILRYNIKSDTMLASIEEEISQVQNYIRIQKLRKIDAVLTLDIPDDLRRVKIIKFVLQPFVENSFKYRRETTGLRVCIAVARENHLVTFRIRDNGEGIAPRRLEELNGRFVAGEKELFRADKEIGLFNINERLRLFYGEKHHIRAASEDGWTEFIFQVRDDISILRPDDLSPGEEDGESGPPV